MPGRQFNSTVDKYRYGMNGQEKDDEIASGIYTADFWEYDSRIGRRWNTDPLSHKFPWQSVYCTFDNRPIDTKDEAGAEGTSTHTDKKGNVLAVYDDGDLGVYMHKDATSKADIDKAYDANNTSAGGLKMGSTLMWNSFTKRDKNNTPAGKIAYGSLDAQNWLNKMEGNLGESDDDDYNGGAADYLKRIGYAANAGNGDEYDYKTNGLKKNPTSAERSQHLYRGSQISKGIYVSARDVGNYFAGSAARLTNQGKMDFMLTAGGFQLSGNSKAGILFRTTHWQAKAAAAGWPGYGEAPGSNFFQRLGYENVRTLEGMKLNESRIWDRKLK